MSKYDQLTDIEKQAVDWSAAKASDEQSKAQGIAGIYARQHSDELRAEFREAIAGSPDMLGVVVERFQRSLTRKTFG